MSGQTENELTTALNSIANLKLSKRVAQSELAAPNGSASEPLRRSFSEEELRDAALAWMRKNRAEGYEPNADRYHEKIGLLVDFVTDLMQNGGVERRESSPVRSHDLLGGE
jgi:hypothetical protein